MNSDQKPVLIELPVPEGYCPFDQDLYAFVGRGRLPITVSETTEGFYKHSDALLMSSANQLSGWRNSWSIHGNGDSKGRVYAIRKDSEFARLFDLRLLTDGVPVTHEF